MALAVSADLGDIDERGFDMIWLGRSELGKLAQHGMLAALFLPLLAACDADAPQVDPFHGFAQRFGPVASSRAAPLGAGTLDVSADGTTAVAADPDRDAVFLVDLGTGVVRSVPTAPDDDLGQVAIAGNRAFVVARGTGQVLSIDLGTGVLEQRITVGRGPRGVAISTDGGTLHVAHATGELASFDALSGERTRRLLLDADLRDVVVWGEGLAVSRLRSAEVLFLDAQGQLLERFNPTSFGRGESTVAWRLRQVGSALVLAHQYTDAGVVSVEAGGYGDGSFCQSSITTAMVSVIAEAGALPGTATALSSDGGFIDGPGSNARASLELFGAAGALDVAGRSPEEIAIAVPGNAWATSARRSLIKASVTFLDDGSAETCEAEHDSNVVAPVAVAVAAGTGVTVTQGRDPAVLLVDGARRIVLSSEPRPDVGHRMFHLSTALGVSCASCHPEGADDGHPWNFDQLGLRRSQNLRGGISELAPFHWDGSLPEFGDLMKEVFESRMGLDVVPSSTELQGMVGWLDRLSPGASGPEVDAESAARGRELFESQAVGCAKCHTGPRFADSFAYDVGTGGVFFTPPLTGIGSRPPYMHDSCAPTLEARFGACGGGDLHGVTSHLSATQIGDLVAFLQTL